MEPTTVIKEIEASMTAALEQLSQEFVSVRTGKASPALVENLEVHVAAYGSKMKLNGLAVISSPEPRMLVVQPFDPSTVPDIEKAIRESNTGLNPVSDGKMLRLPIPELTEERRVQMTKIVKGMAEDSRVRIRACRKDGMDQAKKMKADNALTEDGQHDFEAQVQTLTDKHVKEIDEKTTAKEAEIMTV